METNPTKQRQAFYRDYVSGQWSMSELCRRFQISRPTGYKWIERLEHEGPEGVKDRSRAPDRHPNRTPPHVEQALLQLRVEYGWGATKLRRMLTLRHPDWKIPARSTINELLDEQGLLRKYRRHRRWQHPGSVPVETTAPNQVWPADFKGQFKMRNGEYCFPLTVTDHYSRMLLLCKALPSVRTEGAKPAFKRLFQECGLPDAIRTDNGAPFASLGIAGLCGLNVWWMKLGIVHQRIRPSSPQENGQHERMHKDLKREATRPRPRTCRGSRSFSTSSATATTTSDRTKRSATIGPPTTGSRRRRSTRVASGDPSILVTSRSGRSAPAARSVSSPGSTSSRTH
ncbi:MAG: helix-turn-helix domain-containing protein [Myxococcota bacterium]